MGRLDDTKAVTKRSWVRIRGLDPDEDQEETFFIVSPGQANVEENKIPEPCLLAQTLIGAKAGERIPYESPGGHLELEVVDCGSL